MASVVNRIYRIAVAMIVVAWTIVVASAIDPIFPEARGLLFSSESNLANGVAFFFFCIGIITVCVIVVVVAVKAFRVPE